MTRSPPIGFELRGITTKDKLLPSSLADVHCQQEHKHVDNAMASVYFKTFSNVKCPIKMNVNQV